MKAVGLFICFKSSWGPFEEKFNDVAFNGFFRPSYCTAPPSPGYNLLSENSAYIVSEKKNKWPLFFFS